MNCRLCGRQYDAYLYDGCPSCRIEDLEREMKQLRLKAFHEKQAREGLR